jgi:hypothetical protein
MTPLVNSDGKREQPNGVNSPDTSTTSHIPVIPRIGPVIPRIGATARTSPIPLYHELTTNVQHLPKSVSPQFRTYK